MRDSQEPLVVVQIKASLLKELRRLDVELATLSEIDLHGCAEQSIVLVQTVKVALHSFIHSATIDAPHLTSATTVPQAFTQSDNVETIGLVIGIAKD